MPKTLNEIKKQSAYPVEFEKAIGYLKITREHTPAVVEAVEKLIRAPPPKHPKPNELERLALVAQKEISLQYMPYFVSGSFYETLQATADVCNSIAKKEREVEMETYERVITPIKSWIQEDFPRLMKDVKKCYTLKDKMDRTLACAEARRTPERVAKAEEASKKHNEFFERVKCEVLRYKAVHRHHMQCLKVLMFQSFNFERKAKQEFARAFAKCEAEIDVGIAALKELRKSSTAEESQIKESKQEKTSGLVKGSNVTVKQEEKKAFEIEKQKDKKNCPENNANDNEKPKETEGKGPEAIKDDKKSEMEEKKVGEEP